MAPRPSWPAGVLETIAQRASLRVRAGRAPHRFLGIWAVVVESRVFVRSWRDQPDGWNRAWREDPVGAIQTQGRELTVQAVSVRGERVLTAVSRAYLEKYKGPGSRSYAEGMNTPERRATTLELIPVRRVAAPSAKGGVRPASKAKSAKARGKKTAKKSRTRSS